MATASLAWFARHESRLAWRDAIMMLQGGRRGRGAWAAVAFVGFTLVLHVVAYTILARSSAALAHPDKAFFVTLTGSACLAWLLMVSQAIETVTRGFYARADLDLILSSPSAAHRLFAVRIGAIALTSVGMAALLAGPAVDVMAFIGGAKYLLGYGVIVAMGITAAAVAVGATALMFRVVGAKRTRLAAQVVAAIVGAGFVVGIQAAAILSFGTMSRLLMFQSPGFVAAAPDLASPVWLPARAAIGDALALALVLVGALAALGIAIVVTAPAFARDATSAAGVSRGVPVASRRASGFRHRSQARALRWKEWTLLWRDPWLVSQSLMQVLYLLPPALLLWHDFGTNSDGLVVLVPILVMAAGQLAGGLAWLAISGEDAPDLVASAPLVKGAMLRAKIEAVMIAVALPIAPIVIAMTFAAPRAALLTTIGVALAAAGASTVQLLFKAQAKRASFRRRQTSSRLATFAEAFLSISVAAAAGCAAADLWWYAAIPAGCAVSVLAAARAVAGPVSR